MWWGNRSASRALPVWFVRSADAPCNANGSFVTSKLPQPGSLVAIANHSFIITFKDAIANIEILSFQAIENASRGVELKSLAN